MGNKRLPNQTTAMVGGSGQKVEPPTILQRTNRRTANPPKASDPHLPEKPTRRQFTAEYKLQILREADRCSKPGELATLLRREGLYWSHLSAWRGQREAGILAALSPKQRGPKTDNHDHLANENRSLRREVELLRIHVGLAEAIIEMRTADTIPEMQERVTDIWEALPR